MQLSLDEIHDIATTLAVGFETLLFQVEQYRQIERRLRLRIDHITEKSEDLGASTVPSSIEISDWRDEIVKRITPASEVASVNPSRTADEDVERAKAALVRLKDHIMPTQMEVRKCPVAHKIRDQEDFEQDFTTQGKPGDLGCPFAGRSNLPPCAEDPIAAEFHVDQGSTRSAEAGLGRCPIRFLDQHSPEEVAQYFENHKHEIPRSHEICVKRYQANETSIRQLDAKYGNLVSMIQGLGTKHKQYLPENEKVEAETDGTSNKAVEKWAENISHQSEAAEEDMERMSRFDKPLRDVRLGESPSRPWGIQVPIDHSPVPSAVPPVENPHQIPKSVSSAPAPPEMASESIPAPEPSPVESQSPTQPAQPAQIIFNGPVFFGYSPEQAALFLQNLGLGGLK